MIIETNAQAVVQAIYTDEYALSDVFCLAEELRSLLVWNFTSWRIQQHPRSCNKVAHALAALGSVCEPDEPSMLATIPAQIHPIIAEDLAMSK